MLNSDMHTEFLYHAVFQRYREIKCAKQYFTCSWSSQKRSSKM